MTEPTVPEMYERALHFSTLIDQGLTAMRELAEAYAQAEADYRKAKSEAWVRCPVDDPAVKAGEREWTAARREAWVNAQTADLRYARDLAEAMRQAALESVRSRRAQLSAIQTFANAHREEAGLARTGPGMAA
jgi:hypothetical protein